MKKLLYIGDLLRDGTAMHVHAIGIATLFKRIGFDVFFVGENEKIQNPDAFGFKYYSIKNIFRNKSLCKVEHIIEWETGFRLLSLCKKVINIEKPDIVLLYHVIVEKEIIDFCKKHGIKVLVERTEWMEAEDQALWIDRVYRQKRVDHIIRSIDIKSDGVIAISKYLYDFYLGQHTNVIMIPPLFKESPKRFPDRETRTFLRCVYAGSIGSNKDIVLPIISAIMNLNSKEIRFSLDLVGVSADDLAKRLGSTMWMEKGIKAHGRVSHKEALEIIQNSDFSFLLRENKRYAKAGFSTKFAESMLNGVPVICTSVGGGDSFLTDYVNGVILEDNHVETIETALVRLSQLPNKEIIEMKENTIKLADSLFLIEGYVQQMNEFINSI